MTLGGVAATSSLALVLSGWLELFAPVVIAATFSFLIAWLNKGLVRPEEGRFVLVVGVALAGIATLTGVGWVIREIAVR